MSSFLSFGVCDVMLTPEPRFGDGSANNRVCQTELLATSRASIGGKQEDYESAYNTPFVTSLEVCS